MADDDNTQFPSTGTLSFSVLGNIYAGGTSLSGVSRVLTTADEGSGNGLDADTVDGVQASSFLRSDATDVYNCNGNTLQFDFDTAGRNSLAFTLNGSTRWQLVHDNSGNNINFSRMSPNFDLY